MEDVVGLGELLEDGELSDVEYNPLPRPTPGLTKIIKSNPLNVAANSAISCAYNSDTDEQESSESDDSDGPKRPKAPRIRPNLIKTKNALPSKYSIWTQDLQEAALNEKLLNCDVDKEAGYDKSRNVESYNYLSLSQFEGVERQREGSISPFEDSSRTSNKRRFQDRVNVKRRLGHRRSSPEEDTKGPSRLIYDLKVTEADTPEDIASDIANKLYEQKETLILKTIQILGAKKAISLFVKTKDIEGDGGMMILNGARRRTPGGVFLFLIRSDCNVTSEQKDLIFGEECKASTLKRRADRARQRREKTKSRMDALKREGLVDGSKLPPLLTRAELVVKQLAEGTEERKMFVEDSDGIEKDLLEDSDEKGGEESDGMGKCEEESVSNPPPSPATDNRENSSDGVPELGERRILSYDDDFLDLGTDDMDVF